MDVALTGVNRPNQPRRVRARERDARALELRAAGLAFDAIGAKLGVTGEAARQAVNRALGASAALIAERAEELRALEAERLDRAAAAIWPEVEAGHLRAQEVWLRNRARYADLLGLDQRPPDPVVGVPQTIYVDCRLPWERGEAFDGEAEEVPAIEASAAT
jgi:hypothetical protein